MVLEFKFPPGTSSVIDSYLSVYLQKMQESLSPLGISLSREELSPHYHDFSRNLSSNHGKTEGLLVRIEELIDLSAHLVAHVVTYSPEDKKRSYMDAILPSALSLAYTAGIDLNRHDQVFHWADCALRRRHFRIKQENSSYAVPDLESLMINISSEELLSQGTFPARDLWNHFCNYHFSETIPYPLFVQRLDSLRQRYNVFFEPNSINYAYRQLTKPDAWNLIDLESYGKSEFQERLSAFFCLVGLVCDKAPYFANAIIRGAPLAVEKVALPKGEIGQQMLGHWASSILCLERVILRKNSLGDEQASNQDEISKNDYFCVEQILQDFLRSGRETPWSLLSLSTDNALFYLELFNCPPEDLVVKDPVHLMESSDLPEFSEFAGSVWSLALGNDGRSRRFSRAKPLDQILAIDNEPPQFSGSASAFLSHRLASLPSPLATQGATPKEAELFDLLHFFQKAFFSQGRENSRLVRSLAESRVRLDNLAAELAQASLRESALSDAHRAVIEQCEAVEKELAVYHLWVQQMEQLSEQLEVESSVLEEVLKRES